MPGPAGANDSSRAGRKRLKYRSSEGFARRPGSLVPEDGMAPRVLACAIEQIADWHPSLFVRPHVVALVAVVGQYSPSPALFDVECDNVRSRWLGRDAGFRLEVSWTTETAGDAERLRTTMQSG